MTQLALPVEVDFSSLKRKKSLGAAIVECIDLSGLEHKQLPFDKGQLSRWESEGEGIKWCKLTQLMDACGNDAPLLWMLSDRGYDLSSLRKVESVTETENRLLREEVAALRRTLKAQL